LPIYEYRRPDGTTFEVVQAFSDDPLTVDPESGVPVERVLHPPAVHFKGTGFYNTDYGTRKRNRETVAAAEGSSAGKDSASKDSAGKDSAGKDSASDGASAGAGEASSAGGKRESSDSGKGAKGSKMDSAAARSKAR
jgi:predicted nucleic acid-binding Zn ribbon protein